MYNPSGCISTPPTPAPTLPSESPTWMPSQATQAPSESPTPIPTQPTPMPTRRPTLTPTTGHPTSQTIAPIPTYQPTQVEFDYSGSPPSSSDRRTHTLTKKNKKRAQPEKTCRSAPKKKQFSEWTTPSYSALETITEEDYSPVNHYGSMNSVDLYLSQVVVRL